MRSSPPCHSNACWRSTSPDTARWTVACCSTRTGKRWRIPCWLCSNGRSNAPGPCPCCSSATTTCPSSANCCARSRCCASSRRARRAATRSAMQAALESALAELALGPEISVDDGAAIAAWLARHRVAERDARALTRDFSRLLVYRTLVRANLREALRATMPRTLARLAESFEPYFAEFLRVSPPVTHYLRDLTPQFLSFALQRWANDANVPAYLGDLARHEALQVELASLLARPTAHVPSELSLDQGVEFIAAVRLVDY